MSTIRVRCLLQQCTKATLRLQDDSEVTINRGMVAFVAFLKDAQMEDVNKLGRKKNSSLIMKDAKSIFSKGNRHGEIM